MNLFFLRHARACARGPKWRPDSTRPLTRHGENKMFDAARGIQSLDVSFDVILTSPYIRAFRTAEILGEVFRSKKVVETRNLIPEADAKGIIDEINEKYSTLKEIILVGHEPQMSSLISVLLSGKETVSIELRKGGLCKLSVKSLCLGRCATLEWLMTTRQLGRLRRGK